MTPDRWDDLESLFGERGACGGCWCMAWRLPKTKWLAGKGKGNRAAMRKLVRRGDEPGVLAYAGDAPVGWCSVAPRDVFVSLEGSRVLRPLDDQPVWSVSCLFVNRDHRRKGVSTGLLKAAAIFAKARGARIIEGYPVIPYTDSMPAAFAWTGTLAAFKAAGFTEAGRHSEARPIMRRMLNKGDV